MAERVVPAVTEVVTDETILARLRDLHRGASELPDDVAAAIGEAIYAIDAPRYGNGVAPYAGLGNWERIKFERMARVAVQAFLAGVAT